MIKNLSGVIIWTDNLEKLASFYQGFLGLEPHSVREDFIAFQWKLNGIEIRLSLGRHSSVHHSNKDPFRCMLNFDVINIEQIANDLKSRGVKFLREPEKEHWGGWVATFEDIDGNILQLIEQPLNRQ
jgi:predicted enzyme related to lactoylglutathione lyase